MAGSKHKGSPRDIPLVEWVFAILGVLLVAGMLGLLLADSLREEPGIPPRLSASAIRIASAPGLNVVEVEVTNVSRKTGANVHLEGKLLDGSQELETSTATISYVPGESRRRAGLIFRQDPRKHHLQLRVTGYERP